MIGVVIVTHGRLAHEFRAALEHVIASVTGRAVEYGAAVRAAQQVYAKSSKMAAVRS